MNETFDTESNRTLNLIDYPVLFNGGYCLYSYVSFSRGQITYTTNSAGNFIFMQQNIV